MVKYNIDMTMLDGKAVNALTDNKSSQSCNVCGSRPSEMNNLKVIREKPFSRLSAVGTSWISTSSEPIVLKHQKWLCSSTHGTQCPPLSTNCWSMAFR